MNLFEFFLESFSLFITFEHIESKIKVFVFVGCDNQTVCSVFEISLKLKKIFFAVFQQPV
jgi:hypothetical protein